MISQINNQEHQIDDLKGVLYRRQPASEIPRVLNLRPIKGENLSLWKAAWLNQKLATLKEEVTAIEKELERRNQ